MYILDCEYFFPSWFRDSPLSGDKPKILFRGSDEATWQKPKSLSTAEGEWKRQDVEGKYGEIQYKIYVSDHNHRMFYEKQEIKKECRLFSLLSLSFFVNDYLLFSGPHRWLRVIFVLAVSVVTLSKLVILVPGEIFQLFYRLNPISFLYVLYNLSIRFGLISTLDLFNLVDNCGF